MVRLVSDEKMFGVVVIAEARKLAEERGLDLVEISPDAKPPVVKMVDYGKFKYEAQKRAHEAKKKQVSVQIKEVKFRPNIDKHDLDVKLRNIAKFLGQGDKVQMVMQFRGRENAYRQAGLEKFQGIIEQVVAKDGQVETEPKFMGTRIQAIVTPLKKGKQK